MKKKSVQISDQRSGEIARLIFRQSLEQGARRSRVNNALAEADKTFEPVAYRAKIEKQALELGLTIDEYFDFLDKELRLCGFNKYADKIRQAAILQPV
jgi:hypothetical protein